MEIKNVFFDILTDIIGVTRYLSVLLINLSVSYEIN